MNEAVLSQSLSDRRNGMVSGRINRMKQTFRLIEKTEAAFKAEGKKSKFGKGKGWEKAGKVHGKGNRERSQQAPLLA